MATRDPPTTHADRSAAAVLEILGEDCPTLAELTRHSMKIVLAHTGGNKARAARLLDVDLGTLERVLGLTPPRRARRFPAPPRPGPRIAGAPRED